MGGVAVTRVTLGSSPSTTPFINLSMWHATVKPILVTPCIGGTENSIARGTKPTGQLYGLSEKTDKVMAGEHQ